MSRRERYKRRRRNRGSPIKRIVAMSIMLTLCAVAVGALAVAGWVVNVTHAAPNITRLKAAVPGQPSEVFAGDGEPLGYIWSPDLHATVTAAQIPKTLKAATIAIEDRRFYQHGALDYQGIVRAAIKDAVAGGDSLQGASTLTMQLIDNVYLPKQIRASHNLKYKIVQAKLAEQLEQMHSKNWILTSYLNDVPYGTVGGQTAYGVQAASEMFFDKPVGKLNLAQSALLAGLPQAPSEYNPFNDAGAARRRRLEVLTSMVKAQVITQAQANAANRRPLEVKRDPAYIVHKWPYVFDYVQQQLEKHYCPKTPTNCPKVSEGGLKIYTTIDLRKQQEAVSAILAHEGGPGQPAAGLATVDPDNGHILAIASSTSYSQTSFNYATSAHRQPGSSFKTFALMTLIHDYHGDPNQTYYNSHFLAPGWLAADPTWEVHTAEETYQGDINVTKATVVSDNTVFAQLAADIGWEKLDQTAYAMGITTHLDGNPSEVIGGLRIGVTPLEMADAYATLANGGTHYPATILDKVVFPDGSVDNLGATAPKRVFTDGEAYAGTQVLKGVITSGTGTAADYGCPAAGKTGTANDLDNAWFVGYTPRMSTAVWVGFSQGNIPMADGFGGTLAAPIWHDFMQEASSSYCGNFPRPSTPFEGTAYFGGHASTGKPDVGTDTTGTDTTGQNGGTPTPTTSTNNPTSPTTGNGGTGGGGGNSPAPPGNTPATPNGGTGLKTR